MKILLSLILLLSMPSALKVEQIPFPAQCPAETSCEPLDYMQYRQGNDVLYALKSSASYKRYKNNFDSVIWQTFFDDVPLGHVSLTERWHLDQKDTYEYTQIGVRIDNDQLNEYTHLIQGDVLAYAVVSDVLKDFEELVSDDTLTDKEHFDQQADLIRRRRLAQYRTDNLNGILVYQEAGEVPDELLVLMAQKAFDQISGYYSALFDIALKAALAAEMENASHQVELISEGNKYWLKLSEKAQQESETVAAEPVDDLTEKNDWLYVSIVLTILFAMIAWFFGYAG
ncbi:hypothetical protein [Dielma fastidiosa]|uniref:Uncharacterized protein n=1 Tax=Dielma fastidiosa TaxID=1034346 RepID=A0A318L5V7_9FIRM|nr:hypothetical protein [Dielma fastidiosa]PXX77077.1 hypothetical protein DES51_11217 [Dielma fastidiosa]